ncbi:hypothetical protein ACS5NO_07525 [Larkinella sp. GY13]|uniref:hypothetical protein n=1 Tax=Larkinella sp. GY13 TaxID=3453720 RepID=UPI003EEBAA52
MHPTPQHRTILNWIQPSDAERYEIYSELGLPQAVLTIEAPHYATLDSRFGSYRIQRQIPSTIIAVTDAGGSSIVTIRPGWWGRLSLTFDDGRELRFNSSSVFRSRWLWSSADGEPQAVVQRSRIFFAPEWPIREGLSALLAGLSIYFIVTRPKFVFGFKFSPGRRFGS